MWGTFEQSRRFIKEYDFSGFQDKDENLAFCQRVKELAAQYAGESTSRAKAECLEYILLNARLDIAPEGIFALRINHCGVMNDFTSSKMLAQDFGAIRDASAPYESTNTFKANIDFGHIAPDWGYLLRKGISGIIADLEQYRALHLADPDKASYYDERIKVYAAMRDCFERFATLAEARGDQKSSFIAKNLRHLTTNAPETMAQAMQLILLYYMMQTWLDTVLIRSLGGLDRLLYPFYKSDLEGQRYTEAQLAEITKYFFWEISCLAVTANLPFYIGGMLENGEDATNAFTQFMLEQYRALDIYDPKIHVMYHDGMDKGVLRLILEMIREGKSSFVFINAPIAAKALEGIGIAREDAKKVIAYGCYETAAEGTEIPCTCAGMINLAKAIELVLKSDLEFKTFEELYDETLRRLLGYTRLCMDTIAAYEPHFVDMCPSLMMSPTYRSSRERGIDAYNCGAKYNNASIVGAGLATLVDSLIAIKHLVYEQKRITLAELRAVLDSNWAENQNLRLFVKKHYAKFGNNQDEVDALAADVYVRFADFINGKRNGRGGVFKCGMFSVDWRFWMGETTAATPNGRYSGEPLSKNLAATVGQDKQGVTAYLQSVLRLDAKKCPDGYVADVVLHCSAVKGEEGMTAFIGLLETFMKKGGFSIHFNILSPETLLNAQREPEKYQNLQIRLCGWNVRFLDLDKAQQDEFIRQSANAL